LFFAADSSLSVIDASLFIILDCTAIVILVTRTGHIWVVVILSGLAIVP
jgi:hypothetical protein